MNIDFTALFDELIVILIGVGIIAAHSFSYVI